MLVAASPHSPPPPVPITQIIRVVDGVLPGGTPVVPNRVDIGLLNVSLTGVRLAGDTSPPIPSVMLPVGGTWGAPSAPVISNAVCVCAALHALRPPYIV